MRQLDHLVGVGQQKLRHRNTHRLSRLDGVQVVHTGYTSAPTIELTWALILASARNLVAENASLRGGGWQQSVGDDMAGRTLGVLGAGDRRRGLSPPRHPGHGTADSEHCRRASRFTVHRG
jgi:hypothetical protein